jgi:ferric-dicitrate binding protein FerR (iron transport regulator)
MRPIGHPLALALAPPAPVEAAPAVSAPVAWRRRRGYIFGACAALALLATALVVATRSDGSTAPGRALRLELGGVALETRDAAFKVDASGGELRIAVERGSVRVHPGDALVELANGEIRVFHQQPRPSTAPPTAAPPTAITRAR